jgi:hypothetical protein
MLKEEIESANLLFPFLIEFWYWKNKSYILIIVVRKSEQIRTLRLNEINDSDLMSI